MAHIEDANTLRIVHRQSDVTPGERIVDRLRGAAPQHGPSADELMDLLRGD